MIKWIAAFLGYFIFRFQGAIIGYIVGSLLDTLQGTKATDKRASRDFTKRKISPAKFELNLLTLCSIVIKADGQATQRELDYVRQYFLRTYGKEKTNDLFRTFNRIVKKERVSAKKICTYLEQRTRYEVRLQLLHFLFGIAQADGQISLAEAKKLKELASYLRMKQYDFESIKAMFIKSAYQAYKILEVSRDATDNDIKKAYRRMAKKYHPDRVVTENKAIREGAEEKFKEIQKAYETIQKERGMS